MILFKITLQTIIIILGFVSLESVWFDEVYQDVLGFILFGLLSACIWVYL
jgi:hypothetical protein